MVSTVPITCPFCGGTFDLALESFEPVQEFQLDCELCCRPLRARLELDQEEILSLDVSAGW